MRDGGVGTFRSHTSEVDMRAIGRTDSLSIQRLSVVILGVLASFSASAVTCQLIDSDGKPIVQPTTTGKHSFSCGLGAVSEGVGGLAVGTWVDKNGNGIVDDDELTIAKGEGAVSLGAAAKALAADSVAIGAGALADGKGSVSLGAGAKSSAETRIEEVVVEGDEEKASRLLSKVSQPALAEQNLAAGQGAKANGQRNIVLGVGALAEAVEGSVTLDDSGANPRYTFKNTSKPQKDSVAIGTGSRANGDGIIVIGEGAVAEAQVANVLRGKKETYLVYTKGVATNSIVVGAKARSNGTDNVVIGSGANTGGDYQAQLLDDMGLPILDKDGHAIYLPAVRDKNSTVVGVGASSARGWGTALGFESSAYGYMATAIGVASFAIGESSTAVGSFLDWSQAFGTEARLPGSSSYGRAVAFGIGAQSFGGAAHAWGNYDTAIGPAALTADRSFTEPSFVGNSADRKVINGSVAVGFRAEARGRSSVAVGLRSDAALEYAVAIGNDTGAGAFATAIGNRSTAVGLHSVAMGASASAAWHEAIAIGKDAVAGRAQDESSRAALAVGMESRAEGGRSSALGSGATASGQSSTAVGDKGESLGAYSTAIGASARAEGASSVAVGTNAFAIGEKSASFGANAAALGVESMALGASSIAEQRNSISIGAGAVSSAEGSVALGSGSTNDRRMSVSVGSAGAERQVTNVAAGVADTDAVNYAQLRSVTNKVGEFAKNAVMYNTDDRSSITFGGASGTRLGNVAQGTIGKGSLDAINGGQLFSLLSSASAALGGGVGLSAGGALSLPSYVIQGLTYSNVGDAFAAVDSQLSQLNRGGGGGGGGGTGGISIGGKGSASTKSGTNAIAIGAGAQANGQNGLAVGGGAYSHGKNDVALGGNSKVHADGSTAVGANALISAQATNSVAIGEGTRVTGANGTAVGQGASVLATSAVALGQGSVADRANTVSIGSKGAERQLVNVSAGTAATDAVNVRQMNEGLQKERAYTDTKVASLNDRFDGLQRDVGEKITRMDERIDRMAAMSGAYAGMAMNTSSLAGANRVGVGVGAQGGEQALAIGYQRLIGKKASISFGGAMSGGEKSLMGGAGFSW